MLEFKGKIAKEYKDYISNRYIVIVDTAQNILEGCEIFRDKELRISLKEYREKRTLNANAYYWQLLSKICEATGEAASYRHNMNLRECGYLETDEDGNVICVDVVDSEAGERKADYSEKYHLYPTPDTSIREGRRVRQYYLLRGSSDYDTKEMARLIDIVVEQAKDLEIETATPEQISEYLQRWGVKIGEERVN